MILCNYLFYWNVIILYAEFFMLKKFGYEDIILTIKIIEGKKTDFFERIIARIGQNVFSHSRSQDYEYNFSIAAHFFKFINHGHEVFVFCANRNRMRRAEYISSPRF